MICTAQYGETPHDPNASSGAWAIKGKILPWIAIGSGLNGLLGAEFGFCKRHSVGVDTYFHRWSFGREEYDSTQKMYVSAPRVRNRDKAVFLTYRYYLNFPKWREDGVAPYIGSFVRLGRLRYEYDKGYETNDLKYFEIHKSAGLLMGIVITDGEGFGGDINMGFYYKQKNKERTFTENNQVFTEHTNSDNFGFRLGLNLYFWFFYKG